MDSPRDVLQGKEAMTPTQYLAYLFGLQTAQQVGFLLSVLVAFVLGWTCKEIRDKRRLIRWKRAWERGERMGVRR